MGATEALSPDEYDPRTLYFCLTHYRHWRSRLEWLLNQMRDMPDEAGVIPKEFLAMVPKLVCTCDPRHPSVPTTPHEDPWIDVTPDDIRVSLQFVKDFTLEKINDPNARVIKRFISLLDRAFLIGEKAEENEEEYPTSSALKLMYLLKRAIRKDFEIFEPPARLNLEYEPKKMNMSLSFDLEGFSQDYVGTLLEEGGDQHLKPFQKQHKCNVKLIKCEDGDTFKIVATISKATAENVSLERIKKELIQALKVQQDVFAKRKNLRERGTVVTSVPDLPSVETSEDHETDPKSAATLGEGASSAPQSTAPQPGASAPQSSGASAPQSGASAPQSGASAPQSVSQSTPVTSLLLPPNSGKPSGSILSRQPSNKITSLKMTRLSDEKSIACIVHNRRWTSTFQFIVTNCCSAWNKVNLPRNKRQKFCEKICTCFEEATLIYLDEKTEDVRKQFNEVKQDISQWPQETKIVTSAFVKQLDKPEVWPSLYKFVIYYNLLMLGNKDCLDDDFIPPEIHDLKPGSTDAPRSRHQSSESYNSYDSYRSASGSSSPENTATLQAAASGDTSRSAAENKTAATTETHKLPRLKPYKLKRVAPQEWTADCFFHGPKRKCVFQCVLNHLHDVGYFPFALHLPFSMAVCSCGETTNFGEYYASQRDCIADCRFMKTKLLAWKGEKKASIQPLVRQLDELVSENQSVSDGFLRFVFHFKQVSEHRYQRFVEIKTAMKKSK